MIGRICGSSALSSGVLPEFFSLPVLSLWTITMETAGSLINDLWLLSTSAAVLCYIFAATVLTYILNYPEISDNERAGILTITLHSFALSIILAYNYRQALKKLKVINILEELSNFPNFQRKGSCASQSSPKLAGKCPRTRFSFPMTAHETLSYHCNEAYDAAATIHPTKHGQLPKSGAAIPLSSSGTGFKEDEIHVQLHNCVKDLGSIIQHVKLLNHDNTKNLDSANTTNLTSLAANPEGKFIVKDRDEIIKGLKKIPCKENNSNSNLPQKEIKDSSENKNTNESDKIVSEFSVLQGLLQSQLPDEDTPAMAKIYIHKQYLIHSRSSGHFLEKIPSDQPKRYSFVDLVTKYADEVCRKLQRSIQRVIIWYFKRKTTRSPDSVTPSVFKKPNMPKIPMKPCLLKMMKMAQHGRQTTRKQYISALRGTYILSGMKYTVRKNAPKVSRFVNEKDWRTAVNKALIKSEEMTLPLNRSLYTGMTHPPSSLTDKLVMKLNRTDAEMFYEFLNDIFGNPKFSQQQKDKRTSQTFLKLLTRKLSKLSYA